MRAGRDVTKNEGAIATKHHHASGAGSFDAGVLLNHGILGRPKGCRVSSARLGQRDLRTGPDRFLDHRSSRHPDISRCNVGGGERLIHPPTQAALAIRTDVSGASAVLLKQRDDGWLSHVAPLCNGRAGNEVILTVKQPIS